MGRVCGLIIWLCLWISSISPIAVIFRRLAAESGMRLDNRFVEGPYSLRKTGSVLGIFKEGMPIVVS